MRDMNKGDLVNEVVKVVNTKTEAQAAVDPEWLELNWKREKSM